MQYDTRATRHYATRHHATRHMLTATLTRARTHTQTQVALNSEDWSASEQRHRQGEAVTYEAGSVVGQVGEACLNSTSFLHHPHRVVAATPCLSFFLSLSPTLSRSIFLSCCVCAREGCVCARETRLRRYKTRAPLPPALHCTALHCVALHCIGMQCIALHCICIVLDCIDTRPEPLYLLLSSLDCIDTRPEPLYLLLSSEPPSR